MLGTLATLYNSPIGQGLRGAFLNRQGSRQMENSFKPDSYETLANPYAKSQGLINKQTNFGNYSSGAMDLSNMQGNTAANTAMMAGMGGSAANALRNRMRASGISDAYKNFTAGLGDAARQQYGIDSNISNQMFSQNQAQRGFQEQQGRIMKGTGLGLMSSGLDAYSKQTDAERQGNLGQIGQLGTDIFGGGGLLQGVMGQGRDALNSIKNIWSG